MPMALLLGFLLLLACTMLHYEVLRWVNRFSASNAGAQQQGKIIVALLISMLSHIVQIVLFAVIYFFMRDKLGFGSFGGSFSDTFSSFLYFSAETYTSVGYGDIYPTGLLRVVSSIETLLGLLLISWSASFSYLEMQRHWAIQLPR